VYAGELAAQHEYPGVPEGHHLSDEVMALLLFGVKPPDVLVENTAML
jgi:hypothetical protein